MNDFDFDEDFNFASGEWSILRSKLEKDLKSALDRLSASDCTHDEANQFRGRISYIKSFFHSAEAAARRSR